MKQYIVCKVWPTLDTTPSVVAHFNDEKDALTFAHLSRMSDNEHKYAVYRAVACTK